MGVSAPKRWTLYRRRSIITVILGKTSIPAMNFPLFPLALWLAIAGGLFQAVSSRASVAGPLQTSGDVRLIVFASCRFRFQSGTGELSRDFLGFNWDWNLASVPIETENSARSGENGFSLKCGFQLSTSSSVICSCPRGEAASIHGSGVDQSQLKPKKLRPSLN